MNNLITGLIFSIFISPVNLSDTCKDFYPNHPVRSDIMIQVVLKSYGYYEGQIDGLFGKKTRNSFKETGILESFNFRKKSKNIFIHYF